MSEAARMEDSIKCQLQRLKNEREEISDLILRVPTGARRNELTEAHIHLCEAVNKLEKLSPLPEVAMRGYDKRIVKGGHHV